MNTGLDFCLALHRAHAIMQLKLDDDLGTYHGISFGDFALLNCLAQADSARLSISTLALPLGQPQSAVLRQLIALEKIGLVRAAHATVVDTCNEALAVIEPPLVAKASTVLAALFNTPTRQRAFPDSVKTAPDVKGAR